MSVQAFADLSPATILDAVEAAGFRPDGRITALNSYENRVYQLGREDAPAGESGLMVAKFYRPGRWSDDTILEEHAFALDLLGSELPVVAPWRLANDSTLFHHGQHRLAVFPSIGGRPPALDQGDDLRQMGRLIARLHNIGESGRFWHRAQLNPEAVGQHAIEQVNQVRMVPAHLEPAWAAISEQVLGRVVQRFAEAGDIQTLRIHGDCHPGNVLWRDDGPWLLDLDDCCTGPAIQDLWMYLSGDREYQMARLSELLEGYSVFRSFDVRELHLVEALRGLRILHYLGWIAERWEDPAFPRAFPDITEGKFWESQILDLREQLAALDEPPLDWQPGY
ncbi:serine/threonine protein kinase [Natronospira bacteriovora]|uniref:Stress response kinase A n=1 Tax=Natronospira bacteriovora TaxID=3069753 RepID=A0ABU0W505_9GAMM|nr:serine/threonine protein kinase [Natronospira sp. AB-CW4]MDQ2069097.1 serine/threonine protein kinase [Natronospira sp. AB-CW4]